MLNGVGPLIIIFFFMNRDGFTNQRNIGILIRRNRLRRLGC